MGIVPQAIGCSVAQGENATIGSFNTLYTPDQKARIDALLDSIYGEFKDHVGRGRGLDPARVEALAQGRVWVGAEAAGLGLVDRVGGLHEALGGI